MKSAYDNKNEEDFHDNTDLIVSKLDEIEKDKTLKSTISQLSELTGLHRNTIRDREWPITRLKEIKEKRKKSGVKKVEKDKSHFQVIEDKLDNAQKELVYWYRRCQENEYEVEQLEINYKRMANSKNKYEKLMQEERDKNEDLMKKIDLLNQLIES